MIAANELRIGNWIDDYHSPYDRGQVTAEHFSTVCDGYMDGNPIPLTPKILEALGFKKDTIHDSYVIWQSESGFAIEYFDNAIHMVGETSAEPLEKCKYLHQFQNLFFALTGTELQINIDKLQKVEA